MLRACARTALIVSLFAFTQIATAAEAQSDGPPRGEVQKYSFDHSRIFPGTVRDYWVYVPKQYDPVQTGLRLRRAGRHQFNAPAVFDELIEWKQMPVTIGVFIMHGRVKALSKNALDRFNRSFEYDGLGDNYVRFVLDEILPEVEQKTTADGRPIHFSHNGNDRCIGGASSGAICAFTAAWERPDAFTPRVQRRRHLRRPPRRQRLSDADPQVRAQAASASSSRTAGRSQHRRRRLVDGQPGNGTRPPLCRLRSQSLLGRRQPQCPPRHRSLSRGHALALERLAQTGEGRRRLAANAGNPHPRRALEARRPRLQIHRRSGRQRQGRSLLQRHPQQQDLQDRPRRHRLARHCRQQARQRPGLRPRRPALRRRRAQPTRSSPTTSTVPSPASPSPSAP